MDVYKLIMNFAWTGKRHRNTWSEERAGRWPSADSPPGCGDPDGAAGRGAHTPSAAAARRLGPDPHGAASWLRQGQGPPAGKDSLLHTWWEQRDSHILKT